MSQDKKVLFGESGAAYIFQKEGVHDTWLLTCIVSKRELDNDYLARIFGTCTVDTEKIRDTSDQETMGINTVWKEPIHEGNFSTR